jgi:hypothetical protein
MFVRGYDTKFCDIDKDSHLGLDRNCRLKGTIAVYIGGSIFGWTSKSTTLRVRLTYTHTRSGSNLLYTIIMADKKMISK